MDSRSRFNTTSRSTIRRQNIITAVANQDLLLRAVTGVLRAVHTAIVRRAHFLPSDQLFDVGGGGGHGVGHGGGQSEEGGEDECEAHDVGW